MNNHRLLPFDENHRRVARQQLARSLVIEAGAGTGKTTLLVDRIISLIEKHGIGEILAVTFTEKAAVMTHQLSEVQLCFASMKSIPHGPESRCIAFTIPRLEKAMHTRSLLNVCGGSFTKYNSARSSGI